MTVGAFFCNCVWPIPFYQGRRMRVKNYRAIHIPCPRVFRAAGVQSCTGNVIWYRQGRESDLSKGGSRARDSCCHQHAKYSNSCDRCSARNHPCSNSIELGCPVNGANAKITNMEFSLVYNCSYASAWGKLNVCIPNGRFGIYHSSRRYEFRFMGTVYFLHVNITRNWNFRIKMVVRQNGSWLEMFHIIRFTLLKFVIQYIYNIYI